jgi:uncharacterized protein with FMN-binding domain
MHRIVVAVVSTISGVVLLFSYHTSTMGAGTTTAASGTSAAPSSGGSGGDGTFTGDSVDTQWGPVQVEITVSGGRITAATAVVYPNGNPRDAQINAYALPVLSSEVVAAQSSKIDTVSGATVTSDGYIGSLQSALDQADL